MPTKLDLLAKLEQKCTDQLEQRASKARWTLTFLRFEPNVNTMNVLETGDHNVVKWTFGRKPDPRTANPILKS